MKIHKLYRALITASAVGEITEIMHPYPSEFPQRWDVQLKNAEYTSATLLKG